MKKSITLLSTVLLGLTLSLPHQTLATTSPYYNVFNQHFFLWESVEHWWVGFNGCESGSCLDTSTNNTFFTIGDYGVKQGIYQVAGPDGFDRTGKFVLKFDYKIVTTEASTSTADVAYLKVKDVATNTVYYYKTLYPADATADWVSERVVLDPALSGKQLQLVFEISNDAQNLTTLQVNSIGGYHTSSPEITGRVVQQTAGKNFAVAGTTVELKNKAGTTIVATAITDADGYYDFYPVTAKRKFQVVSTVDGASQTQTAQKLVWSANLVLNNFQF